MNEISLLDELSAADCWCGRSEDECADSGGCRWTRALAAETRSRLAERDLVHADLSLLLRLLGLGDHARPQSSHEVFLEAVDEVGRIIGALRQAEDIVTRKDTELDTLRRENERLRSDLMARNDA